MKTKNLLFALSFTGLACFSQVVPNIDYETTLFGPDGTAIESFPQVIDVTGTFAYIAGHSFNNSTQRDYFLIKYDANTGAIIWQQTYDFVSLMDRARAVTVDNSGNVYVTGESQDIFTGYDLTTLKYDPNGNLLWSRRFNGTASMDDKGTSIDVDNVGNVYVCGYASNTGTGKDFIVIKYNSAGVQQFVYTKNGTAANSNDVANKLVWNSNKIYVTGNVTNLVSNQDIYLTSLSAINGNVNWFQTLNGTANGIDQSLDIKLYGNDLLICGGITNIGTGQDYFFSKFNSANGIVSFTKTYNGFGGNDFATSLVADASNKYAVVGLVQNGSNYEYHTVYFLNNGNQSWINKHITNSSVTSVFPKITTDIIANHFYVSGVKQNSTLDGSLYQITPTGNETWSDYHDCINGLDNAYVDMAIDNMARIYVAGVNEIAPNVLSISMIRYSQTPVYNPINFNNVSDPFTMSHLFYPNSGEVRDAAGVFVNNVLYYTKFTDPAEYIQKNQVSFCKYSFDTTDVNPADTSHRVDMVFQGASESSKTYPFNIQENLKLNYFITGDSMGITNVKGAAEILVPDIYPMIDLHYSSNGKGSKYFFVVKPTGDPTNIKLFFDGASSTSIVGTDLKISTILGSFTFKKPDVYNVTPGFTTPAASGVTGWTNAGTDTYTINTGSYNSTLPLVIEFDMGKAPPSTAAAIANMDWSTHLGGPSADDVKDLKVDNSNNLYVVGQTLSYPFPNTAGSAIQGVNYGSYDGFIAKFNNTTNPGVPVWATYIGGENADYLNSLDFGPNGDIYCVGGTSSNNPALPTKVKAGAWAQSYQGPLDSIHNLPIKTPRWHYDGLICQVNPNGDSLKWLTRVANGGSDNDESFNKIKFDPFGNFFAVGYTRSVNTPTFGPAGSFKRPYNNGAYTHIDMVTDGWITKFNSAGAWVWSTTIGASTATNTSGYPPEDYLYDIAFDANGDVYVAGTTQGNNYITFGGGLITGGNYDGVISRFDNNGVMKWSSHVGGSGYDYVYAINTNTAISSNLYVAGIAQSGFPTVNGGYYYNPTHNGGTFPDDVLFAVYNSSNTKTHATYIGGNNSDEGRDIEIDNNGVIHISGKTRSANFYTPVTNNGYYVPAGKSDLFICSLFPNMSDLLWTGIIGSDGDDAAGYGYEVEMAIDNSQQMLYLGSMATKPAISILYPVLGSSPTYTQNYNGNFDGSLSRFDLSTIHNLVGIGEIKKLSNDVFVYPNPAHDKLYVKLSDFSDKYTYVVYNSIGQLVIKGNLENYNNSIELRGLRTGMYFLELKNGKERLSAKFIKHE